MRLLLMSSLLLLTLSVAGCEKSKPITMKLLPAGEVGPEAAAAKGPRGEPAIEVIGGAAGDALTLAVCDDPALSEQDHLVHDQLLQYVVRGRVKSAGVEGNGHLELLSEFTRDKVEHTYRGQIELDGNSDWGSFEFGPPGQSGMLLKRLTLSVVLPAGGRVTVAEPLLVVPRIACVGCSKLAAPAHPAAAVPPPPVFKMPSTGEATDSSLRIGDKFPEIQSVDLEGNTLTLDQALLGDRYTLIVFWATDCGFCMAELPHEVELARQYESAGLRVIGVNAGDTAAIARDAAKKIGLPWLNVLEGPDRPISGQLGIKQLPTLLLLDRDGKVVCATPQLRWIDPELLPDGTPRPVKYLDWVLHELLGDK